MSDESLAGVVRELSREKSEALETALKKAAAAGMDLFVTETWVGTVLVVTCTPVRPGAAPSGEAGVLYESSKAAPGLVNSASCGCEANRRARQQAAGAGVGRASAGFGPHGLESLSASLKPAAYGLAQQLRAPGKMFSRSDILAILRAQRGVAGNVADAEHQKLINIFESIE